MGKNTELAELVEILKIFHSSAKSEKETAKIHNDMNGRFFQAGRISAFELLLGMIENKMEDENV